VYFKHAIFEQVRLL